MVPRHNNPHDAVLALDSFTSSIAHSCTPNCWILFQSGKLQLRALRNIQKDEELTMNWIWQVPSYLSRRKDLKTIFDIKCRCALCLRGPSPLELNSPLLSEALRLARPHPADKHSQQILDIERVIKVIEKTYGLGPYMLCPLHQKLGELYFSQGNMVQALKLFLKIRFLLLPTQEEAPTTINKTISLTDSVSSLQTVLTILPSLCTRLKIFLFMDTIECGCY